MNLPSSYMHEPARSAVRFTVVGTTGTGIQYGWYYLFLWLFGLWFPGQTWTVSVAFTVGFVLEMVSNYLLQSYYVFSSKPDWRNLTGFLTARAINYVLQMVLLWMLMTDIVGMNEKWAGIVSILVAGVANYLILKLLAFRKR